MKNYGIGIVGVGWVAGAHIEALKAIEGVDVVAVCSRRRLDPAELKRRFGIPLKVYNKYDQMLADPTVDVVDICTEHPAHPAQAIAAARAGKHLIIEKPIALTLRDAEAMRKEAKRAKVQACVCFECRYSGHFRLIRSLIDRGLLGEIHYAEVDYYHGIGPWYGQYGWNIRKKKGGSSLLTAGCHALDGLLMFIDSPVREVFAYATVSSHADFKKYEYPTTTATILRFANGAVGKVASVIDCLQPYYFHIHLVGSAGSLLDDKFYSEKLPGLNKKWSKLETSLIDSGDVSDHPYRTQFDAFFRALRAGKAMEGTDLATAFETHRVIFAADQSAATGKVVKL
ncbi:MAG TPA: Gfo/Idh/MocA family oxidoreductase [Acidobacteriota bacterium]|nr:Gfo/Idh/MocA family oxidoreductase [Acidobacteriota bacterium]